jgi:hypothetical protein
LHGGYCVYRFAEFVSVVLMIHKANRSKNIFLRRQKHARSSNESSEVEKLHKW